MRCIADGKMQLSIGLLRLEAGLSETKGVKAGVKPRDVLVIAVLSCCARESALQAACGFSSIEDSFPSSAQRAVHGRAR